MLEYVEQMKKKVKEHFTVTHEIGCMASFIVRTRPEVPIQGDKIKEEAQAALDKCEKDEVETEEKVNQWKKNNRKWLKRKNSGGAKACLVEKLCDNLKPNFLLSDLEFLVSSSSSETEDFVEEAPAVEKFITVIKEYESLVTAKV